MEGGHQRGRRGAGRGDSRWSPRGRLAAWLGPQPPKERQPRPLPSLSAPGPAPTPASTAAPSPDPLPLPLTRPCPGPPALCPLLPALRENLALTLTPPPAPPHAGACPLPLFGPAPGFGPAPTPACPARRRRRSSVLGRDFRRRLRASSGRARGWSGRPPGHEGEPRSGRPGWRPRPASRRLLLLLLARPQFRAAKWARGGRV